MVSLHDILYGVNLLDVKGPRDIDIKSLAFDSRKVVEGTAFVAVPGTQVDGHEFIGRAISSGAKAIVCEKMPRKILKGVTYVKVESTAEALGLMASNFYENPSENLKLVAITGTNGKTSTVTLLHAMFMQMGYLTGLLSTVENKINDEVIPATHTTPDPIQLNELLAKMVESGCEYCFMEASSHAIHQRRIAGLKFEGAGFTNITHDHLDYHGTFKEYIAAKKMLFDGLRPDAFALVNADDKNGLVMTQNTRARVLTYALKNPADFKGKILENTFDGLTMLVDGQEFHSRLVGEFNAYNLLLVYGISVELGIDRMGTLTALSNLKSAEGRFDYFISPKDKIVGVIDYAHTPDALKKVLSTIQKVQAGSAQLLSVVGCGGDRDKTKRPLMAKAAVEGSDQVFLTSDNPRSEKPEDILADMKEGLNPVDMRKTITISDRKEAIRTAIRMAKSGDVVLVAGKGHEKYQEINGVKTPFDDMQILSEALKEFDR